MEKSNKKKLIIIIVTFMIIIGAALGGIAIKKNISNKKAMAANAAKEVKTKTKVVSQTVTVDGTIAYDDEVKYYANEDDKLISKVLVEVGDLVEKGQTIVEYDMDKYTTLQDNLKKEKLNLTTLQLDLGNLTTKDNVQILTLNNGAESINSQIKEYEGTIKTNENQIKLLKSKQELLEKTLKQDKELFDKGYKNASEIKESENTLEENKDNIEKLNETNETLKRSIATNKSDKKLNAEKLKIEQNKTEDKSIVYKIKVKQQEIAIAKLDIAAIEKSIKVFQRYTKAEKSGVVTEVNVTDGQTVIIGTDLLTIADSKKLIINADVSEYEVKKLALGDKAIVTGDGFEKEYTATITKILPVAKTDSDDNIVVPIELSLEKVSEEIRNNYTVSLKMIKTPVNKSILVPVSVITRDSSGKSYVNVQNSETKKISKKEVSTGEIVGTDVEVTGLKKNEIVMTATNGKASTKNNGLGRGPSGGPPHDD